MEATQQQIVKLLEQQNQLLLQLLTTGQPVAINNNAPAKRKPLAQLISEDFKTHFKNKWNIK